MKNMNEIEDSFDLNNQKGTNAQTNEKDLNKNLIDQNDLLSNNEDKLNKNSSNKSSSINQKAEAKKRKVIGKKRTKNNVHNKYSIDNTRRRIKHKILESLKELINKKIEINYNGNIGNGVNKKKILMINKSQKSNGNIAYNKEFLKKKLVEIFSDNISKRYTFFPQNHNKKVINDLINESDENIKNYFNELFNLNFLQCMRHFREEDDIDILEGLNTFNDFKDEIMNKDGNDFWETLKYNLYKFEIIINIWI